MLGTGANPLLLPNKSLLVLQKDLKSGKLETLVFYLFCARERIPLLTNVHDIFQSVSDNLAGLSDLRHHDLVVMTTNLVSD